jgi:hypothetical protein
VELGNRIHQIPDIGLLRINRKKKKRTPPLPKIIKIYGTLIVFFNKLLWCPYGVPTELEGYCPPTPSPQCVVSVESLHLSVRTCFAFAVDRFSPTFVAVVAVSVAHLIFVSEFSTVIAPVVFAIYDFSSF